MKWPRRASGSVFADWWAYKFGVYDAIPQNACLMHDRGTCSLALTRIVKICNVA